MPGMSLGYLTEQPTRAEVDALDGATVVEFGANWCGICAAAKSDIDAALERTGLRRIKAEDAKGRPLGRSFGVKLWPTLVLLRDGEEVGRVVRPSNREQVERALADAGLAPPERA